MGVSGALKGHSAVTADMMMVEIRTQVLSLNVRGG
jgi:hypothetical protein